MNYFNYYTEIEEAFQKARQSGMFLLSPLDWALIESWKEAGVPLEAALKGIDRAFEKWHSRKRKFQRVNSLTYCSQEVLAATKEMAEGGGLEPRTRESAGFEPSALYRFFAQNAAGLRAAADQAPELLRTGLAAAAESLDKLAEAAETDSLDDLEAVEQRLTVLEEKLHAGALQAVSEDELVEIRTSMQRQLAPHRSKMSAEQLSMLERQYLQRQAFERASIPRLSLFYLR